MAYNDRPKFLITEEHLALLARSYFDWDHEYEWGGISQDQKRPFGNSDVVTDVIEIIGREVDTDEAYRLHKELAAVHNQAVRHALDHSVPFGVGVEVELTWRASLERTKNGWW